MPVEIDQLIINARVVADNTLQPPVSRSISPEDDSGQLEIVERCVAEILRILEDRQER